MLFDSIVSGYTRNALLVFLYLIRYFSSDIVCQGYSYRKECRVACIEMGRVTPEIFFFGGSYVFGIHGPNVDAAGSGHNLNRFCIN